MKVLAAFIMRGRTQAIVVTAVSALLSLLIPPLSYLSGAAVGLVTLRVGPRAGLGVVLGAALAAGLLAAMLFQQPWLAGVFVIGAWLPVWALASTLRRTVSLPRAVLLSGFFGLALVFGFYAVVDDPASWWVSLYGQALERAGGMQPAPEVESGIAELAAVMTGAAAAALTLSVLGALLIARWWQALLYNPGGFRDEFHRLALGRAATGGALVLAALATLLGGSIGALFTEALLVVLLLFLIQGIAVAHGLVARTGANRGWLGLMYVLLLVPVTLTQTAVMLAVVGIVDNWFDFRAYFGRPRNGDT